MYPARFGSVFGSQLKVIDWALTTTGALSIEPRAITAVIVPRHTKPENCLNVIDTPWIACPKSKWCTELVCSGPIPIDAST